jgi:hypothetical protein
MAAAKKIKNHTASKDDDLKEKEEDPKEGVALSDGVLDALVDEETVPIDPLLVKEDDLLVDIDKVIDEEDEDSLDYNPDEW